MALHLAYLVNQHPAVSHTFIRREIEALERSGVRVARFALRGWDTAVVDDADRQEQCHTRYVLKRGLGPLALAFLREGLRSPARLWHSLRLASRMASGSDRSWWTHFAYLLEACVLRRWTAESKVEHLHAHFATNSAEVAMLVRALGGPPYSFTAHGSDIMDRPAQVGLPLTVAHAAFVVAVCSFGRSQIFKWVRHDLWPKVHVLRCGLPPGYGRDVAPAASQRRQLLCIGRLSSEKGQLLLVEAAKMLANEGTRAEIVLVGDGPTRAEVEALISASELTAQIHVAGSMNSAGIEQALAEAGALVIPSLSEGLPMVIMEAMAAGRPVIAPYLAGIPELVVNGRNGWLYPAGDVAGLAAAMRTFMHSTDATLRQMGEHARADVWRAHDADVAAGTLVRLIQDNLGSVPAARYAC